jgi:cell division protein FtsB
MPLPESERRWELVQALHVAPFISADESLVRCRQGADEIKALIREIEVLRRENADLRDRLDAAIAARPRARL